MPRSAISFVSVLDHRPRGAGIERPELQRFAISAFAENADYRITRAFVEELVGEQPDALLDRPVLEEAIEAASREKIPIIVASLGRLARDARALGELMAFDVTFIVSGLGVAAEPFVLMPLKDLDAAVSQQAFAPEADDVPDRDSYLSESGGAGRYAREVLAPRNRRAADIRAQRLAPVIGPKLAAGKSLRQIADELNAEGVPTARGGRWHLATVQRLVARLKG